MDSSTMLARAKFFFDLRGYLIIRNVLTAEEIEEANKSIDAHTFHERKGVLRNTSDNTSFSGDMKTGRLDMGGMLGWEAKHNKVFRSFLAHPKVAPYLNLLVGKGYRLDHSPLVIAQNRGSEGFSLHGGPLSSSGDFIPQLQYVCKGDSIYNSLLAVSFQLTDHNEGSGGFCVVPGSHKINFAPPEEMMEGTDPEFLSQCIEQPTTKAGDVVLFSEATIHGCLPWSETYQRRVALYRFSPSHLAFARGYSDPSWPENFTKDMTEEQLAVMQHPFHPMYDRNFVTDDGSICDTPQSRSAKKKQFDQEVFGKPYY